MSNDSIETLEAKFRLPDGSIDHIAATAYLKTKQMKADSLTIDELRECIQLTRILRRTTVGPAKAKTTRKKTSEINNPDDLMNL